MAHQVLTPIGVFNLENEKFLSKELFPKEPGMAAQEFRKREKDFDSVQVNLEKLFNENNFQDFKNFIHEFNAELTKLKLREELAKPDARISQVIECLEEIDSSTNLMAERLREWYSLYFPELSAKIRKHESFSKVLLNETRTEDSIGAELSETDLREIKNLAQTVSSSYKLREDLSSYLENLMQNSFPNLKAVATSPIGAKLISLAGDSQRLSRLPSSTIQVLGAEKALFRHLKTGAKPPKYGAILQHPILQNTPRKLRGKVARALSAKINMAIKRDVFGGDFIGNELKQDLQKKVERIKRK